MTTSADPTVDGCTCLKIATYNMHGFKRNWSYLKDLTIKYDLIFIQEHWLLLNEKELIQNINNEFVVYAKSSMDARCEEGVLLGRPFGGVAVLIRKSLCNMISFCGCDCDGRVICVKILNNSCNLLLFGCYFPCNDHSANYLDTLSRVLGYIESVAVCNPGFRIGITGDLNFECSLNNQGFVLFKDFADEYSLVSCDDMLPGEGRYTYHHRTLNHKSLIDHLFIGNDLKSMIVDYSIVNDYLNLSDHYPVVFSLNLAHTLPNNQKFVNKSIIREYRWDKGNLIEYYNRTGNLLNNIKHDLSCVVSGENEMCCITDHLLDIEIYYSEIVHN